MSALVKKFAGADLFLEASVTEDELIARIKLRAADPELRVTIADQVLGAADPAKFAAAQAEGRTLPGHHNSHFEPLPEPTLRTGMQALTSTAISLLQN